MEDSKMLNTFENKDRFHQRRLERERHMEKIDHFSKVMGSDDDAAVLSMVDALSGLPLKKNEELEPVQKKQEPCCIFLLCLAGVAVIAVVSIVSALAGMKYKDENEMMVEDFGFELSGRQSDRYKRIATLVFDWGLTSKGQLQDDTSPSAKALNWLVEVDRKTESAEDIRTRYALATLYFATQKASAGYAWQRSTNWLSELPVCLWYGVYCHDSDWESIELEMVGGLNLTANGLISSIPNELFLLENIRSLDLSNNALSGTISASIGLMQSLQDLYLGPNLLTSTLPTSIGKIQSLSRLYINDCLLTGTIPTEIESLTMLQALDLSENRLSGYMPQRMSQLSNLSVLYLDDNALTGPIGTLTSSIVDLRLRLNMLSGDIPTEIGSLQILQTCYLDSNLLIGTIPYEMGRNVLLQDLHLYNNRLSGGVPASFGHLEMMRVLYLDHNYLTSLPLEIGLMHHLESLFINNNVISGSLPVTLSLLTNLKQLLAHSNRLTGRIPDELGFLVELGDLKLHDNYFEGDVPTEVCTLRQSYVLENLTADCGGVAPSVICNCCSMCY